LGLAFGPSAWRRYRRRSKPKPEPEPEPASV
jgi:hypothetical protein